MMWQPIETAPKDGTCILIFDGKEVHEANWGRSWLESVDNWAAPFSDQDEQGGRYEFTPTHWMPMPGPPSILITGGCNE